ncbi:6-bladed beta-propeller [endosymbiont of Lamellibrachia barhami]|uniref:6-bladed beta-propeller n=1 Tax=endosymbiont of Lamellibrachia barhami TaxID=205975 RepID=UPI0015A8FD34
MNLELTKRSLKPMLQSGFLLAAVVSGMLLVSGCATHTPTPEAKVISPEQFVWPAPPQQPRVRYLGSLKSLEDVAGKPQQNLRDRLLGKKEGEHRSLIKPYGVHSDSKGRVFVADSGIAGLVVFDIEKKDLSFWGVSGPGAPRKPLGVTSDAQGNVYVSDVIDHRVVVFDNEGNYLNALGGQDILITPVGMVFNDRTQRLYVVDSKKHQIIVFDREGNVDFTIGQHGSETGNLNSPTNIAIDEEGRLYVADTLNFRVQIFAADGTHISTFGNIGDGRGDFSRLKGIGVDKEGHIYAVDAAFNNFQVFSQEGQLLLVVGQAGTGPGGFYLPAGAHVDKNNRIFIADQFNTRIQMFEYLGESDTPPPPLSTTSNDP